MTIKGEKQLVDKSIADRNQRGSLTRPGDKADAEIAKSTEGSLPVEQKPAFPPMLPGDAARKPKKPAPGKRMADNYDAKNVAEESGKTLLEIMAKYNSGSYAIDMLAIQQCQANLDKAQISMPELEAAIGEHQRRIGDPKFYATKVIPEMARACTEKEGASDRFWQLNEQVFGYLLSVKEKLTAEDAVSKSCHLVPDLVHKSGGDPDALAEGFRSSLSILDALLDAHTHVA